MLKYIYAIEKENGSLFCSYKSSRKEVINMASFQLKFNSTRLLNFSIFSFVNKFPIFEIYYC